MSMLIGYARASTQHQNLYRQIAVLRKARCLTIFTEKASGKSTKGRPELEKAIDALGTGHVLVLAEWDRATRSMTDGLRIIQRVADRGARLKVLDRSYLDLTTTLGQGILAFLSALAQDEREQIVKRAEDGRRAAKVKGVKMGRKPKLTEHQVVTAKARLSRGESCRPIARDMGVRQVTISRIAA